jgi:hypothetical protein
MMSFSRPLVSNSGTDTKYRRSIAAAWLKHGECMRSVPWGMDGGITKIFILALL